MNNIFINYNTLKNTKNYSFNKIPKFLYSFRSKNNNNNYKFKCNTNFFDINKKTNNKFYNNNFKCFSNYKNKNYEQFSSKHGTTVLAFKKDNKVTMIADGLMTLGHVRFKTNTIKIKKLTENIICGFAGSVADCVTLMELLENEVENYPNDLLRASVSFAKTWRTNRSFRRISASLLISDGNIILNVDGEGNVIEIKDGVIGIGSGGLYAQCAARALLDICGVKNELKKTNCENTSNINSLDNSDIINTSDKDESTEDIKLNVLNYSNKDIAIKAMDIATDLCIYSNKNYIIEEIEAKNNKYKYNFTNDLL